MGNKHDIIKIDRSYSGFLADVVELLEQARRASARSVNAVMTVAYWEVGRRVVEHEQQGKTWAGYGEALVEKLAADLTQKFGKGFSQTNAKQMREFYLAWPIRQTLSDESKSSTAAEELEMRQTASDKSRIPRFPLPSSHYVRLLTVKHVEVRIFYDTEALRGGWSVRQLDR